MKVKCEWVLRRRRPRYWGLAASPLASHAHTHARTLTCLPRRFSRKRDYSQSTFKRFSVNMLQRVRGWVSGGHSRSKTLLVYPSPAPPLMGGWSSVTQNCIKLQFREIANSENREVKFAVSLFQRTCLHRRVLRRQKSAPTAKRFSRK